MSTKRSNRAIKVEALVKEIDSMARGQGWEPVEGPVVLRNMLAKAPASWWALVAEQAECNAPSDDTVDAVLAVYADRTRLHVLVAPVPMIPSADSDRKMGPMIGWVRHLRAARQADTQLDTQLRSRPRAPK